jgi:hypothetical protein
MGIKVIKVNTIKAKEILRVLPKKIFEIINDVNANTIPTA